MSHRTSLFIRLFVFLTKKSLAFRNLVASSTYCDCYNFCNSCCFHFFLSLSSKCACILNTLKKTHKFLKSTFNLSSVLNFIWSIKITKMRKKKWVWTENCLFCFLKWWMMLLLNMVFHKWKSICLSEPRVKGTKGRRIQCWNK